MTRFARLTCVTIVAWMVGCGESTEPAPAITGGFFESPIGCDAGDEAFIKRVVPMLWGRRPVSIVEVELLKEVIVLRGREALLRGIMDSPEFVVHWQRLLRDRFLATRAVVDDECEGAPLRSPHPDLARHIRDNPPDGTPFADSWNVADLAYSTVLLDDMSVWLRTMLFVTVGSIAVDADNIEEERAVRGRYLDFFEDVYINRRMTCLQCHNSQYSVTQSADPALDRTWEIPGLVERALYGDSAGRANADVAVLFRVMGAVSLHELPPDSQGPP
ncbi:MAG: hypothetical protein ACI9OJ_001201 [Myxococcota bacterium]|jgi:hypothetical protein